MHHRVCQTGPPMMHYCPHRSCQQPCLIVYHLPRQQGWPALLQQMVSFVITSTQRHSESIHCPSASNSSKHVHLGQGFLTLSNGTAAPNSLLPPPSSQLSPPGQSLPPIRLPPPSQSSSLSQSQLRPSNAVNGGTPGPLTIPPNDTTNQSASHTLFGAHSHS